MGGEVTGVFRTKSDAVIAARKKARELDIPVERVWVRGRVADVQGQFLFCDDGSLALAYCSGGPRDEAKAESIAREVRGRIGTSPTAVVLQPDGGSPWFFDADGKVAAGTSVRIPGGVALLLINRSGAAALVKAPGAESSTPVPDGENAAQLCMGDALYVRSGPPGNYVYWKAGVDRVSAGGGSGGFSYLILLGGDVPEESRISKEEFGDETPPAGAPSVGNAASSGQGAGAAAVEVTVVLPNGARFKGEIVIENDQTIKIRSGGAEMEWEKKKVKEILRSGK